MSSRRGRGFADTRRDKDAPGTEFERLKREERLKRGDPAPSIEGWVVIVTGLHDVCHNSSPFFFPPCCCCHSSSHDDMQSCVCENAHRR